MVALLHPEMNANPLAITASSWDLLPHLKLQKQKSCSESVHQSDVRSRQCSYSIIIYVYIHHILSTLYVLYIYDLFCSNKWINKQSHPHWKKNILHAPKLQSLNISLPLCLHTANQKVFPGISLPGFAFWYVPGSCLATMHNCYYVFQQKIGLSFPLWNSFVHQSALGTTKIYWSILKISSFSWSGFSKPT